MKAYGTSNILLLAVAVIATAAMSLTGCVGLRQKPPKDSQALVVIRDATVVDVASGALRPHTTVVITGSRITEVGPVAATTMPLGARVIEGDGRFLIPGLWDMHSHSLWSERAMASFLPLYVAQGVTGIRDMGGRLDVLSDYRAAMKQGNVAWPRVIAAGQMLDGPDPVHAEISIAVTDAHSAIAAVDLLKLADADFIKVYTTLGREGYFAAIAEARRVGLRVAGHLPGAIAPEEAALAGQASIEHLRDELEPLLCSPLKHDDCVRLAALFREHRTWQVPTLVALRNKAHFDDPSLASDPRSRYLPAALRTEWLAERDGKLGRGSNYLTRKRAWYTDEAWVARTLVREKVPMLAGSDAGVAFSYPGFSLHDELALLVEMGMTPLEALRAATLSPADFLGERASMGAIEAGKVADMVLLRENPLANIGATREIEAVVLRGRVFDRQDLDILLDAVAAKAQE